MKSGVASKWLRQGLGIALVGAGVYLIASGHVPSSSPPQILKDIAASRGSTWRPLPLALGVVCILGGITVYISAFLAAMTKGDSAVVYPASDPESSVGVEILDPRMTNKGPGGVVSKDRVRNSWMRMFRWFMVFAVGVAWFSYKMISGAMRQEERRTTWNKAISDSTSKMFAVEMPQVSPHFNLETALLDVPVSVAGIRLWLPSKVEKLNVEIPVGREKLVESVEAYCSVEKPAVFRVSRTCFLDYASEMEGRLGSEVSRHIEIFSSVPGFKVKSSIIEDFDLKGVSGKISRLSATSDKGSAELISLTFLRGKEMWQIVVTGEGDRLPEISDKIFKSVEFID